MIHDLTAAGANWVLHNLRACDDKEFRATIYDGDIPRIARALVDLPGAHWQADLPDSTPVAIGGFTPLWEGVAGGWLWSTDDARKLGREVTKFIHRFIFPALDQAGFHRVECRALAGNDLTLRWLHLIGFREEAVVSQFGRGREDFILLARLIPHARTRSSQDNFSYRQAHRREADAGQLRFAFLQ